MQRQFLSFVGKRFAYPVFPFLQMIPLADGKTKAKQFWGCFSRHLIVLAKNEGGFAFRFHPFVLFPHFQIPSTPERERRRGRIPDININRRCIERINWLFCPHAYFFNVCTNFQLGAVGTLTYTIKKSHKTAIY